MATVVMVTGKRVGGLSYALQSSEWLEFNMVERKAHACRLGTMTSLLLFLSVTVTLSSFTFNHSLSENVTEFFIVFIVSLCQMRTKKRRYYPNNCVCIHKSKREKGKS